MSARDQDNLSQLAQDAGFAAVVLKPVTPSLLLDNLMRVLQAEGHAENVARTVDDIEAVVRERCRGARLLLAEDNPVNQEVARELLQAAGLVVDIAGDGEEALRMLRRSAYDLVLMDVQMPRLDGLQATRQLRQLPGLASLPVIAMTANAFAEDRLACIDAGMNDHLAKPVDPRVLYETLLQWLPERSRIAQPAPGGAVPVAGGAQALLQGLTSLDREALLQQCAGKPELAVRVLRQFLGHYRDTAPRLLAQLQAGGDLAEPRRTLHSLRGAAGSIGAFVLREQVQLLEAALHAGAAWADLGDAAQAVEVALDGLIAELAQRLDGPAA